MEALIDQISANPLYLAIAAVLAVILVVAVVKKVMKLIVILAIALIAFAGFLHFTGREVPTNTDDLQNSVSKQVDKVKNSANQTIKDTLRFAKEDFSQKLKEKTAR